jgi:hypothetical protein
MKPRITCAAVVILLLSLAAVAEKNDKKYSDLTFTVIKDTNGKPVRNASVVLHPVTKNGKQERGGVELKTDADGKANYNSVPYGKMRIQVLAPGYQTYGEDLEIAQPAHEIVIKLKPPAEQYSIYK